MTDETYDELITELDGIAESTTSATKILQRTFARVGKYVVDELVKAWLSQQWWNWTPKESDGTSDTPLVTWNDVFAELKNSVGEYDLDAIKVKFEDVWNEVVTNLEDQSSKVSV